MDSNISESKKIRPKRLKIIFVTGTAGAGKSLLVSKIYEYYTRNGAFASILNLDPGVENLPYTCDIDVRDHVDIVSIMKQYDLGPNGALIMANDLIASKIDVLQDEVSKVNIFLYDGALITSAVNFVSIALLATSIKLRLGILTINVITKTDLISSKMKEILQWSTNLRSLEAAILNESDGETYILITNILRGLNIGGFAQGLFPISNVTGEGMINLQSALSRIINLGEEVED